MDSLPSAGGKLPATSVVSRQVAWFEVYEFVAELLSETGSWPTAGTPSWAALPDDDPRKLAAVLAAGTHWALRVDCEQTVRAQASQDISTAAKWKAVAQQIHRGRGPAYIPRRKAAS